MERHREIYTPLLPIEHSTLHMTIRSSHQVPSKLQTRRIVSLGWTEFICPAWGETPPLTLPRAHTVLVYPNLISVNTALQKRDGAPCAPLLPAHPAPTSGDTQHIHIKRTSGFAQSPQRTFYKRL